MVHVAPSDDVCPIGQATQLARWALGARPELQLAHATPSGLEKPDWHGTHAAPISAMYLPAGQAEQLCPVAALLMASTQAWQRVRAELAVNPSGHGTHAVPLPP